MAIVASDATNVDVHLRPFAPRAMTVLCALAGSVATIGVVQVFAVGHLSPPGTLVLANAAPVVRAGNNIHVSGRLLRSQSQTPTSPLSSWTLASSSPQVAAPPVNSALLLIQTSIFNRRAN